MKEIKLREKISKNGSTILAGKDSESNEYIVSQVEKDEEVFHTKEAGSPFVNIKGKPQKGDIKYAAIFCAKCSRDWKKNKGDVLIHRFKGRDIYKDKKMKKGTFGIKKYKLMKIKRSDIEEFI